MMPNKLVYSGITIERISHDAFKISTPSVTIYIDPYNIPGSPRDGDIVICTHDHFDHCSIEDVEKVAKEDAVIVASINCEKKVKKLKREARLLKPGDSTDVKGVKIVAIPAYNINKPYHPREYQGIGVVIELDGTRIYHAGDTDYIPEMKQLRGKIDIALLPVSGTYVMDADEAVKAALEIQPKIAVPMHWGAIVGSKSDAERFKEKLEGKVRVEII